MIGGIKEINFDKKFRQGNRIYDSDHIAMYLTAQSFGNASGYSYLYAVKPNFYQTANELIFVGGIGENLQLDDGKRLSRNFKQGYRVYSSEGIACSLTVNGGGIGGCTGLYLVEKENNE